MSRDDHHSKTEYALDEADAPETPGEGEGDEDAEFRAWWAQLPDFITPGYPLDIPPARMPFVQYVFTEVGAPRFCPVPACHRAKACQGGNGPPCFRVDRRDLSQVLFLWWMRMYADATDEDYDEALRARRSRYAPAAAQAASGKPKRRR